MTKPAESYLHEQCQYTCKAEAATQFHGWPYAKNATDAELSKTSYILWSVTRTGHVSQP